MSQTRLTSTRPTSPSDPETRERGSGEPRGRWLGLACALVCGAVIASCSRPRQEESTGGSAAAPSASVSYGDKIVLSFDLSSGAPESTDAGGLFGIPPSRTYVGLVSALKDAGETDDVGSVFVNLGGGSLDWARAEELGRLFGKLRESGKPVVCHAHAFGNSVSLFTARACDRIWLSPAGDVETVGLAGQVVFLKGVLDKLGVQADFLHMGKYKSFAEQFTREDPSPEARESLTTVLASIRTTWIDSVKKQRPGVEAALEDGPWSADQAKQKKLVDEIGYESDALEDAKQRGTADKVRTVFGPKSSGGGGGTNLAALIRSISGANRRASGADRIAVVPAVGGIAMSSGGFGGGIAASSLTKTLRRLAKDDSVKAVVLRIDSPGGSALASDLLWHELMEVRAKKPLIASVGSMAASGGYYMACAANEIFAERTSIVGSIGVVGGKFTFNDALAEHGINAVTIPARPDPAAKARAAFMSPLEPWDDATRERMRQLMQGTYQLFLKRVADGRGLKVSDVEPNAQGRIWSGAQGKDKRLVDTLGGLRDAVERAKVLADLEGDVPLTVEGGADGLFDILGGNDNASAEQLMQAAERALAERETWLGKVTEPMLPHAQAFAPVLSGEHTLATMPYALILR
ncbi:MAG: signal peptide peptidase SppA [Myxococcales bacterium]|nr:signal peptide peptidase SppA [Myxococcales bacterium]